MDESDEIDVAAELIAELDAETKALESSLLELTAPDVEEIERQLESLPHLTDDRKLMRSIENRFKEARQAKTASELLNPMPGPREALHAIISGRFALWDFVPAACIAASCSIECLHLATLGFSRSNIEKLCRMVDDGQIHRTRLLASHYFKGTSKGIYEFAVEELAKRPSMEFLSLRTHAKVALIAFENGRHLSFESSANLRSCKNIEQVSIFGGRDVYDFHRTWIDDLFSAANHGQ